MHEKRLDGFETLKLYLNLNTSKVREYNCSIIKTDFTDLNQNKVETCPGKRAETN